MKKGIHPRYNQSVQVKCSCGKAFTIGSAKDSVETEICSNCHPFYTGKEKLIDKAGQVQRFKDRLAKKK